MTLSDADMESLIAVFEREYRDTKSGRAAIRAIAVSAISLAEQRRETALKTSAKVGPRKALSDEQVEDVIARCALRVGMSVDDLLNGENRVCQRARWAVAEVLTRAGMSTTCAARALGYRDHTVVIYGRRHIHRYPDMVAAALDVAAEMFPEAMRAGAGVGRGMDGEEVAA